MTKTGTLKTLPKALTLNGSDLRHRQQGICWDYKWNLEKAWDLLLPPIKRFMCYEQAYGTWKSSESLLLVGRFFTSVSKLQRGQVSSNLGQTMSLKSNFMKLAIFTHSVSIITIQLDSRLSLKDLSASSKYRFPRRGGETSAYPNNSKVPKTRTYSSSKHAVRLGGRASKAMALIFCWSNAIPSGEKRASQSHPFSRLSRFKAFCRSNDPHSVAPKYARSSLGES